MKHLSDYLQDKQTKTFDKYGAFFAFGIEQFKKQQKPNTKYVNLGAGLLCPKENTKQLIKALDNLKIEGIKQDVKENGASAIIEREYFNYETQISDDGNALDALEDYQELFPELFSNEMIKKEFGKCFEKAIKNDWF